jgi:DNA-binding NarL/FixJ family response regulator
MTREIIRKQVLLVEDHALVRTHLQALLQREPDLEVCSVASAGETASSLLARGKPNLIIINAGSAHSRGFALLTELKALQPHLPVLILSLQDETSYAERALKAGAAGFITKEEATANILPAVRKVLGGGIYVSERMAERLRQKQAGKAGEEPGSPLEVLTEREWEVFQRIGAGMKADQMALDLGVGIKTVESYRRRILEKLQLIEGSQLANYASQWAQKPATMMAQP